jgi:hypothetical protein
VQFQEDEPPAASTEPPSAGGSHPQRVRWSYALSPLALHVSEHRKPLYKFVVDICAIVGGALAVLGLADALLHGAARTLLKREMGKQL